MRDVSANNVGQKNIADPDKSWQIVGKPVKFENVTDWATSPVEMPDDSESEEDIPSSKHKKTKAAPAKIQRVELERT